MSTLPSLRELIEQSGKSAPSFFSKTSKVGDKVTGTITAVDTRQARDIKTNKPKFWENGDPMVQVYVELSTELQEDAEDDGLRSVFIKFWTNGRKALLAALEEAKLDDLEPGMAFTAEFIGEEPSKRRGEDAAKLYQYTITRQ